MYTCLLQAIVKCESPCYEAQSVPIEVMNPFPEGGVFRIVVIEASNGFTGSEAQESAVSQGITLV